ncbi:hypothetical protein M1B34_10685 [Pseudomonas sp. MAFF 302030]|uniref:Lipoprotein n=1 Tax=Pseudomonas morbosilactucae TaxID=2938197 RepID=A0A9X2C5G4_9PSED|nr:hypothetical protein [Pseudomonas morbosilactucae]MCK9798172.1 hypothetical protein [Pseudomonas morbosilactucae]MCK9815035.1 hypothetical protein [Pseudomonas morbosilactucae]
MSQLPLPSHVHAHTFSHSLSLRLLGVAGLLVSLAGCGALTDVRSFSTPYSTPPGGETVRVRVISDGMVRGVPRSDCVDFRLPGAGVMVVARDGYANRNGESLGMPAPVQPTVPGTRSELLVPAGQPIAFHYLGAQCYNLFSFVPKAGMDYQVEASGLYKCGVMLKQAPVGSATFSSAPLNDSKLCRVTDNL